MKKMLFVSFFFVWCTNYVTGQALNAPALAQLSVDDTDRLKQELYSARDDSSRVNTLEKLCWAFKNDSPETSLDYGQKALALSRKMKYPAGEARSLVAISFVQRSFGNYVAALELVLKSLKVAEQNNLLAIKAWSLERIGVSYLDLKNYELAINNLKQSIAIFESNHDDIMMVPSQLHLATAYLNRNQLDSGFYYAKLVYNQVTTFNLTWLSDHSLEELIKAYELKGDLKTAIQLYRQFNQRKNNSLASRTYINLTTASLFKQFNLLDSAAYFAERSLTDALKGHFYNQAIAAAKFLADLYRESDLQKSADFMQIALAYNDSLINNRTLSAVNNILNFNAQERQYEIETAKIAFKNQIRQYGLLSGLGVLLLLAFIFYRNHLKEKQAKNLLHTQHEMVQQTLSELKATQAQLIQSEKLASLGELTAGIAHEIQNPLNFVNNFAEVSAEMLGEMKEEMKAGNTSEVIAIADDLEQNLSKINHHGQRASSIVKGMLEHSRASKGVKEPTDLNALADEYLRLAYHGLRAKDNSFNATLETHFDPDLPKVSVIPQDIGRVLLNLINNAFYAVTVRASLADAQGTREGRLYEPTVTVSTKRLENAIEIRVEDNGSGIPEAIKDKIFQPFFTTKPTGQGTGLGLSLAYDIVTKSHGGVLEVETRKGEETRFIIQLPLKPV